MSIHQVATRLTPSFKVLIITGKYPGSVDEEIKGVTYRRIGVGFGGPLIGQIVYQLFLPLYVMTLDFDLWIESFTPPFSTAFLPLFTRKPVIGLVHFLAGNKMRQKYKLPFDWIEKIGLKIYKRVIVLSDSQKAILKQINQEMAIKVINNGVEIPEFRNNILKKHILYIGRIEIQQKGLDLLIEAIKKIHNTIIYPVVIAGSGLAGEEKALKKMISDNNLTDKIELVGRAEGNFKKRLYEQAVLVVIPSRNETFPMVVLESMAYGVPFVAFDIEGLSWVNTGVGLKVKPFQTEALGEAIINLINNKKLKNQMSSTARNYIGRFSWDKVANNYRNYIYDVIQNYS